MREKHIPSRDVTDQPCNYYEHVTLCSLYTFHYHGCRFWCGKWIQLHPFILRIGDIHCWPKSCVTAAF